MHRVVTTGSSTSPYLCGQWYCKAVGPFSWNKTVITPSPVWNSSDTSPDPNQSFEDKCFAFDGDIYNGYQPGGVPMIMDACGHGPRAVIFRPHDSFKWFKKTGTDIYGHDTGDWINVDRGCAWSFKCRGMDNWQGSAFTYSGTGTPDSIVVQSACTTGSTVTPITASQSRKYYASGNNVGVAGNQTLVPLKYR